MYTIPPRAPPDQWRPGFPEENEFRSGGKVWRRPCPRVLPMGFAGSVTIACGVQDAFCEEAGLPAEARFSPLAPVPRKVPIWGACIDDVWGLAGKSSYYEVAATIVWSARQVSRCQIQKR